MVCIMHLGILIVMLLTRQLTALLHLILRLNIVALKMLVGDVTPLSITDVDQSQLPFSKPLYLKNILLVPDIKNNLISIFQFTLYKEVTIEFDSSHCCIKDKSTKEVLIIIKLTNGLSQLDLPHSSTRLQPCIFLICNGFQRCHFQPFIYLHQHYKCFHFCL